MEPSKLEALRSLPRWAVVAFAARCARRVEPLFRRAWPAAPEHHVSAVARAVVFAERCASDASSSVEIAKMLALHADLASHRAQGAAYSAAHAAANAAGTVAYPEEASTGAYYAAIDASDALREVAAESDTPILDDLARLEAAARDDAWTDETAVPPELFLPLPVHGGLTEDEDAKVEAYETWERAGRLPLSKEEQDDMYFDALERVRARRRRTNDG